VIAVAFLFIDESCGLVKTGLDERAPILLLPSSKQDNNS
jgi:hypothetical protein